MNEPIHSHFDRIYRTPAGEFRKGIVYLLHFARPIDGRQHYVGWTTNHGVRWAQHHAGGSNFTTRAAELGVPFAVAKTWPNRTVEDEERIQRQLAADSHVCPICRLISSGRDDEANERFAHSSTMVWSLGTKSDVRCRCGEIETLSGEEAEIYVFGHLSFDADDEVYVCPHGYRRFVWYWSDRLLEVAP